MNFIVILTIIIATNHELERPYHIEYRSEKACLEAKEQLQQEFEKKIKGIVIITCSYRQ